MLLYILVLQFYGPKEKKKMTPFWGKKTEEKQNSATIMIFVGGKGTIFPVTFKLQLDSFQKRD